MFLTGDCLTINFRVPRELKSQPWCSLSDRLHGAAEWNTFSFSTQMRSDHLPFRELFQELFLDLSLYNLQVIKIKTKRCQSFQVLIFKKVRHTVV